MLSSLSLSCQVSVEGQAIIRSKFATLLSRTINGLRNIPLQDIREHFELMNLPDCYSKKIFSDESLGELTSTDKVIEFLKKNVSFDDCGLLQGVVERFLPHLTGHIDQYLHERNRYFQTCTVGQFANGFQQLVPPSLGPTTVAVHLNNHWQGQRMQHVRQLQYQEFQQCIPGAPFVTQAFQLRSVFIVWRTTPTAVWALQQDYGSRYLHLKSIGVLQLILGYLELDFTGDTPMDVYELKVCGLSKGYSDHVLFQRGLHIADSQYCDDVVSLPGISETLSMITHLSDHTHFSGDTHHSGKTQQSGQSGESGYMSGTRTDDLI